jgi:hypothetical protein
MTGEQIVAAFVLLFCVVVIAGGSISIWYENYQARKNNIVKWEPGSNNRH